MKWFELVKTKKNINCSEERSCCKNRRLRRDPRDKSQAPIKVLEKDISVISQLEKELEVVMDALEDCRDVDFITDPLRIAAYGLLKMPILVIDDKVVSSGKALDKERLVELLTS